MTTNESPEIIEIDCDSEDTISLVSVVLLLYF